MITDTDITIFKKQYNKEKRMNETVPLYIPKASWYEKHQSALSDGGYKADNIVKIRIPTDKDFGIAKENRVVKGKATVCPQDALTILSVSDNRRRNRKLWHWAVTAK